MDVYGKILKITDSDLIKDNLTTLLSEIKKYSDYALKTVKTISKIDTVIIGAVCASAGAIIGTVFSKSFKKILILLSAICGLGSAYLIYKKYFKD